jgi:small nuclear ribonucleoprotein (snRNP)-like protein
VHRSAHVQLVELKNGETFNGHLVNCDNFMNITLREVYQTNAEGDRFWKLKECYIRGSTVCPYFIFSFLMTRLYSIDLDQQTILNADFNLVPNSYSLVFDYLLSSHPDQISTCS